MLSQWDDDRFNAFSGITPALKTTITLNDFYGQGINADGACVHVPTPGRYTYTSVNGRERYMSSMNPKMGKIYVINGLIYGDWMVKNRGKTDGFR
jgi:hypothetical protein